MTRGGKNLILLGVLSILIALMTTTISLLVYHNSGDIYLDRSRPGFLPDEEEITKEEEKKEKEEEYTFQRSGKITAEVLEEYLEKISAEVKGIEGEVFSAEALDLGIPEE